MNIPGALFLWFPIPDEWKSGPALGLPVVLHIVECVGLDPLADVDVTMKAAMAMEGPSIAFRVTRDLFSAMSKLQSELYCKRPGERRRSWVPCLNENMKPCWKVGSREAEGSSSSKIGHSEKEGARERHREQRVVRIQEERTAHHTPECLHNR